jgi:hypothetical protein
VREIDPCPGCRKGGVCRTPECGRLKLPREHPYRTGLPAQPAPVQEPVGVFVEDDDIGHVRLIPHQQLKLKDGDKLYTTPPAQPEQPTRSHNDYWVSSRPKIIEALENAGFTLMSNADGFWLQPAPQPAQQEPTIAACIIGADAVDKKIDGYEAAKVYAAMQKAMGTPPTPCTWTQSRDPSMPDTYSATCGVVWTFTEGGPAENGMRFCPGCGSKVTKGDAS